MCRVSSVVIGGLTLALILVCLLPHPPPQDSFEFERGEEAVPRRRVKRIAEDELPAQRLKRLLTTPTVSCRKLRSVGGRSCLGAIDGAKLVCMDDEVTPKPRDCLVYSFGVGNDFTFDQHMQDFGCEVHAFDHDEDHEIYDHRIGPSVYFHKTRIGFKTGFFKFCESSFSGTECNPFIRYETFLDIRRSLGHEGRRLDYLKMDVEGGEWVVLENIMRTTDVLNSTSQISLEIHFDDVRNAKSLEEKRKFINTYLDVLDKLSKLGFHLMNFEENEFNPQNVTVDGVTLSVYAEILLSKNVIH